ncbi:unnamed protein product, partial [Nesidiocoris tenuis]
MECGHCKNSLLPEDSLCCAGCSLQFHFQCAPMSEINFRKLSKANKSNWKCVGCKNRILPKDDDKVTAMPSASGVVGGTSGSPTTMDDLKALIINLPSRAEVKDLVQGIDAKIDTCLAKYEELEAKVDQLKVEMEELKGHNLVDRVAKLESPSEPRSGSSALTMEAQLAEMEDRRRRSFNVMIFDFPEPQMPASVRAIEDDLARLKKSLDDLQPGLANLVQRVSRIGNSTPGKPRPLKIVFDSPSTASRALVANRSRNPPLFSASSDKTPAQRAYLVELRKLLKDRIDR